jgi:hypothetical protein
MDRYSPFLRVECVDPYNDTYKGGVQWAVRLEIGRHIDAHSDRVVTSVSGKIQAVL